MKIGIYKNHGAGEIYDLITIAIFIALMFLFAIG